MQKEIMTLGIVDDHAISREAMVCFANQFENCRVILQAGSTGELKEALRKSVAPPDVLLLELNGFKTLQWLRETHPNIRVIILTRFETTLTADRLLHLGAKSVLEKATDHRELKKAISRVREDGYYYNTKALQKMSVFLNSSDSNSRKFKLLFTDREWAFLLLVPTDMTHDQIADKMKVSKRIVNKINNGLFLKLDVRNRSSLAMHVVSHGMYERAA